MVRLIFLLLISIPFLSNAEQKINKYSGDSLKDILNKDSSEKISASQRLKAASGNATDISVISGDNITYILPSGKVVPGVLLPNKKVAPAMSQGGEKIPACITDHGVFIAAKWDSSVNKIRCLTEQTDLKFIDTGIMAQASPAKPKKVKPKEYIQANISTPPKNIDDPQSTRQQFYIPPGGGGQAKITSGTLGNGDVKYGITIGSWVKVELERPASSAETGLIEFSLNESMAGRFKTLPAGTILFAQKNINMANKRMEALIVRALLPSGEELTNIRGRIFSLDKSAGLQGDLIRDREGEADATLGKAALTGIKAAVPSMGGDVAGAVVGSVADDTISNEQRYMNKTPSASIRVYPQVCLLKISESF